MYLKKEPKDGNRKDWEGSMVVAIFSFVDHLKIYLFIYLYFQGFFFNFKEKVKKGSVSVPYLHITIFYFLQSILQNFNFKCIIYTYMPYL